MRTIKALACAVTLAAGLATSMAQSNVYSLNVVGYYNVAVPAGGYYMIANQLNTTNNTLDALLPSVADGSQFYKYNGGYSADVYDATIPGWTTTGITLNPGEAGFFKDVTGGTGQTLTFVGEVLQGQLVNTLPIGNSIRASMVPQAGTVTGTLGAPGEDGDQIYVYNGGYSASVYDATIPGWTSADPGGPVIQVGQGFFYKKFSAGVSTSWVRNFTVQ